MTRLERVGIVGCGLMGAGFAEVCGRANLDVLVAVSSADSVVRGRRRLERSLDRLVRKGKASEEEAAALASRIAFTTDLTALSDRQFVLESITESLPEKIEVFAVLDKAIEDPEAILASNTSSIPIMQIGRSTRRPERVIGVHLFNPVPAMRLIEVISSLCTSASTVIRTKEFLAGVLEKEVVHAKDQAGFLVNSLLIPYLIQAVRMFEVGTASAEDIDQAMTLGCGHPMGPLALIDLIGLDIIASVAEGIYQESKEPLHAPPTLLLRMVEGGLLGKKSGRGFYVYQLD